LTSPSVSNPVFAGAASALHFSRNWSKRVLNNQRSRFAPLRKIQPCASTSASDSRSSSKANAASRCEEKLERLPIRHAPIAKQIIEKPPVVCQGHTAQQRP